MDESEHRAPEPDVPLHAQILAFRWRYLRDFATRVGQRTNSRATGSARAALHLQQAARCERRDWRVAASSRLAN